MEPGQLGCFLAILVRNEQIRVASQLNVFRVLSLETMDLRQAQKRKTSAKIRERACLTG